MEQAAVALLPAAFAWRLRPPAWGDARDHNSAVEAGLAPLGSLPARKGTRALGGRSPTWNVRPNIPFTPETTLSASRLGTTSRSSSLHASLHASAVSLPRGSSRAGSPPPLSPKRSSSVTRRTAAPPPWSMDPVERLITAPPEPDNPTELISSRGVELFSSGSHGFSRSASRSGIGLWARAAPAAPRV